MAIEVEIWSAGKGTKQGYGPFTAISDFTASERVNEAARWGFTVPAEHYRQFLDIEQGYEAYGYMWVAGQRLSLFGGEITELEFIEVGDGGTDIRVTGLGRLNDLAQQYIPTYTFQANLGGVVPLWVQDKNGNDLPNMYDENTGTADSITLSTNDFLYIGYTAPHWNWSFINGTPNTTAATLDIQYWNNDPSTPWQSLSIVSDSTDDPPGTAGQPFSIPAGNTGILQFVEPSDWAQVYHDKKLGYWARLRITSGTNITINIREITFTVHGPDGSDINNLMTSHGGGMSVQTGTGYYTGTAAGYYGEVANTSALNALRQVADSEDGMFRIKAHDDAELAYLRDTPITTDIYAVGPAAPMELGPIPSDHILITGLQRIQEATGRANRLYVYGAGNGKEARITLEHVDETAFETAHSGYNFVPGSSYIEHTADYTNRQREAGVIFHEVRNINGTDTNREASNQLAELGIRELKRRREIAEHLQIELAGLSQVIRAGDAINVSYRRKAVDVPFTTLNNWAFDINGAYTVTAVTHRVVGGVLVADVTASTINRAPAEAEEVLLSTIENLQRNYGHPQRVRQADITGLAIGETA